MKYRFRTLYTLAIAMVSASTALAQDQENVSVRAIPVEASRVSTVVRAADSVLDAGVGSLTDTAANSSSGSVIAPTDPLDTHATISIAGAGFNPEMAPSVSLSTLTRLDAVQTSRRSSISLKGVVIRLFLGTILVGGVGGTILLVMSRMSGGQTAEIA